MQKLSSQNSPTDSGSHPDEQPVEGGLVDFIEGGPVDYDVAPQWQVEVKHTQQRGKLAMVLVSLLSGLLLVQYVSIWSLNWGDKVGAMKNLESTFNAALPVISGLVSSAVTYYFTRNNPRS